MESPDLFTETNITPGYIVGAGRIGTFLYNSNNGADILISSRDSSIPDTGNTGPIYIATRNGDLQAIIDKTPQHRRSDLVFMQNGVLTDFLKTNGLQSNTQALIYLAISKKGEQPTDGITELNPEGLTAVTGKWGHDLASRLKSAGLTCHVLDKITWTIAMFEKHIWICAMMAVGAKHKCTVGEVVSFHREEVSSVIEEMVAAIEEETKNSDEPVIFPKGVTDRLCAYAKSVAHFPTAVKEFEWRNGWFINLSLRQLQEGLADPCPLHTEIIKEVARSLYEDAKTTFTKKNQ